TVSVIPTFPNGPPAGCCRNCSMTCPFLNSYTYTVRLTGVEDLAGNAMSPVSWSFRTADLVTNASIWSSATAPATPSVSDSSPVEVGVKFRANQDGYITGIRFYKGEANTGTHIGHLWDANGNVLGSAVFTNETQGAWQEVSFAAPIPISANTTYVAS